MALAPSVMAAAPAQPLTPPAPVVVNVVEVTAAGRVTAGSGVEVRLELVAEATMGREEESVERGWIGGTDAQGRATFADVPEATTGRSLRASARWRGFEATADVGERGRETSLVVYAVTADRSHLVAELGYSIITSEEDFVIDFGMRLGVGDDLRAVDLEQGEGIRLPLLLFAVGDAPMRAWMPTRPNPEFRFEISPPVGRLVVERGEMVYRGVLPPSGVEISARYTLPYDEDTQHVLALSSPVAVEALQISIPHLDTIWPEVALRTPFRIATRPTAEGVARMLVPMRVPAADETVFVDVHDTPSRHVLSRPLVAALAVAIVLILALVYLRSLRPASPGREELQR